MTEKEKEEMLKKISKYDPSFYVYENDDKGNQTRKHYRFSDSSNPILTPGMILLAFAIVWVLDKCGVSL